ncbi:MAG: hypothetical protein EOM76_11815 [Sphingobacteriia bacterium]|nr:hypothetical protein [Sphingobacteriia bacterium]
MVWVHPILNKMKKGEKYDQPNYDAFILGSWVNYFCIDINMERFVNILNFSNKAVGSTSMLRMFSTNHFLYNLLPYHNLLRWFRNLVMVVGLGITSATEPVANRRGISTYLYGPQLLLTVIVLIIDVRFWLFDLLVILLSGFITVKVICYVKKGDEKHDS